MLARLHEGPLPPGDWVFERKFDGQRVCVVCDPAGAVDETEVKVSLVTRNGIDVAERYPDLMASLPRDRSYVLDAEIVAFRGAKESFSLLQRRMHTRSPDLSVPVDLVVFDCMNMDARNVQDLPFEHRHPLLRELEFGPDAAVVPQRTGDKDRLLEGACAVGWEGLMAKRLDAPYVGRRDGSWLKLKCLKTEEFVIGGYTRPQGTRSAFGALLVGERTHEGLHYVGKVGTGFDERALRVLHEGFQRIRRPDPPFVDPPAREHAFWLDPVLVCRVGYTERTPDDRLRHPRFEGLVAPDHQEVVR